MKRMLFFIAAAVLSLGALAQTGSVQIVADQTATGASSRFTPGITFKSFQASGTTTAGAGAATVLIQGSNVALPAVDGDWVLLGTITLTLATTKSGDGFASDAPWRHVRSNVSAISGTGAAVSIYMGY